MKKSPFYVSFVHFFEILNQKFSFKMALNLLSVLHPCSRRLSSFAVISLLIYSLPLLLIFLDKLTAVYQVIPLDQMEGVQHLVSLRLVVNHFRFVEQKGVWIRVALEKYLC